MKRFNYEEIFEKNHRKYRKNLIILISLLVLFSICFALGLIFANYQNKVLMMVIFSVLLAVITFFIVTVLIYGVIETKKNEKQLIYISNGYLLEIKGTIKSIKGIVTTISGRQGIELIVADGDEEINVFYDPIFGDLPFKENEDVLLKTANSFVVEYEVQNA